MSERIYVVIILLCASGVAKSITSFGWGKGGNVTSVNYAFDTSSFFFFRFFYFLFWVCNLCK